VQLVTRLNTVFHVVLAKLCSHLLWLILVLVLLKFLKLHPSSTCIFVTLVESKEDF
jgi:hypothetical protein